MRRAIATIVPTAAVYGFSIGSLHSPRLATWNVVKFPALILLTCALCALAFFAGTLPVTRRLSFADVTTTTLRTFADLSVLLASLAPASYFLALTVEQPTGESLAEYPFFLGLNVVFIAAGGTLALGRRALALTRDHGLRLSRSIAIVTIWLAAALFAGGQCAWTMRPFFGPRTDTDPAFMEGSNPDFYGATNFYEAVFHLVAPPDRPPDFGPPQSGR